MNRCLMFLAACLLSGCVGNTRNTPLAEVYDFGPPLEQVAEDGR